MGSIVFLIFIIDMESVSINLLFKFAKLAIWMIETFFNMICSNLCIGGVHDNCRSIFLSTDQSHSHTLLQQLRCLPVECRINFKIANITVNTLQYSQPAYLHSLWFFHTPARSPRSSNTNLLTVPFAGTTLGARSFSVASRKIWNSLSPALHSCNCPDTFRRHHKTHYFQQAFSSPYVPPSLCPRIGIC